MQNKISVFITSLFLVLLIILFAGVSTGKVSALYVCDAGETLSYDTAGNPICVGTPERTGFVSTGVITKAEVGGTDEDYGSDGLYLYPNGQLIQSDYFGTLGRTDSLMGVINNIGIKKPGNFGTLGDRSWYSFSKCLDVINTGEYIVAGAGDGGLKIALDASTIINKGTDGSAYTSYWMYPVYLTPGGHVIKYEYNRRQTSETLAGQLIGPFPVGSMIDYQNNTIYSASQIRNFINSNGTESTELARYSITATAPSNWVDNIFWGIQEEIGKDNFTVSGSYTCPEGYFANVVEGGGPSNACGNHGCLKINTSAATYINTVPTIVITAPTKESSGDIADTSIRVTGTGIYATGVSIDVGGSSVNPTDLVCVDTTPGAQVDCTILIQQSGTLSIDAVNEYDSANATESNYVIDPTPPVITITNNVNPAQNSGDEVRATISEDLCLDNGSVFYSYSDDVTCDGSDALDIPYQSNDIIGLYDNTHNGKYICFVAKDCVGNTTYQGTDGPINISPELVITITAPTKGSSGDITNTTIRATGTGVYGSGISIDIPGSTANPRDLVCTNTVEGTQVDCTIVIQQSGDLKINATSAFGNGIGLEQNYIIDKNRPVISIIDDVNKTLNSGDTIIVGVVDDIQLMSGSTLYGFNSGATCDATSIYDTSYTSGTTITLNNNVYNGKYICFTAKDRVGNISYTGSLGPINVVGSGIIISISAPTKSATASITDTTIRVVGSGMYATGVSVGEGTTVDPKNLLCTNTLAGVQVDCTIVIQKSGLLNINATNGSATGSATEPNYVIQIPTPTGGGGFAGGYTPSTSTTPAPVVITPAVPKPTPIAPKPVVKDGCFTPNNEKTIYQGNDVSALFREGHQMFYNYGITSIKGTVEFRPDHYLNRQEAARFLTEFAKNVLCRKKTKTYENRFNDLDGVDPTLRSYIIESYEYGIFKGDSGGKYTTFRPKETIKKSELSAIMIRLITNKFSEETTGDWSKNYRSQLETYLQGVEFSSVLRENVTEVLYSLYKNNKFEMKDVGFVVIPK